MKVMTTSTEDEVRWTALASRDATADGSFVYGVVTTGVFCRPSCPSRLPRRENVRFFDDAPLAEDAGLRPCKRCAPTAGGIAERRVSLVVEACRILDEGPTPPNLAELARAVGSSRYHLHRIFREETGITPKAYADARRVDRMRQALGEGSAVTGAIYDSGFSSASPFYSSSNQRLGMTPSTFRQGGYDVEVRFAVAESSLGAILVAASDRGVCAIELGEAELLVRGLQDRFHAAHLVGDDPEFAYLVAQVVALVEDPTSDSSSIPLDIRGTAFQERVWQALRKVPAGTTVSYAELAASIGSPRSVRAVAGACGANTLAVAIPCHRVVRSDGHLSGYRWGIERKAALLQREQGQQSADPSTSQV